MMRAPIKFCNKCGREVVTEVPDGDNRTRLVCKHCHAIHYVNPLIVAGCVAVYEDSVLLCKRAIEPRARAILLVNPNNPTGSFVRPAELEAVLWAGVMA